MDYTKHNRLITEQFSDSPVTRVRIKRNELVLRYAQDCSAERQDDIYDTIIALESIFPRDTPTVRIKILEQDDLSTVQCEFGNTDNQRKIIKHRGIDFGM